MLIASCSSGEDAAVSVEEAAKTAVEGDGSEEIVAAVSTVEADGKAFH